MKNWLSASCETPRASAQPFQRCMGILASAHFASKTDSAGIPTPVTPSATPSATRPVASPASSSTTSTSAAAAPFTAMWNGMLARVGSLRPVLETMASLGMAQCLRLCQRSQGSEGRRHAKNRPTGCLPMRCGRDRDCDDRNRLHHRSLRTRFSYYTANQTASWLRPYPLPMDTVSSTSGANPTPAPSITCITAARGVLRWSHVDDVQGSVGSSGERFEIASIRSDDSGLSSKGSFNHHRIDRANRVFALLPKDTRSFCPRLFQHFDFTAIEQPRHVRSATTVPRFNKTTRRYDWTDLSLESPSMESPEPAVASFS